MTPPLRVTIIGRGCGAGSRPTTCKWCRPTTARSASTTALRYEFSSSRGGGLRQDPQRCQVGRDTVDFRRLGAQARHVITGSSNHDHGAGQVVRAIPRKGTIAVGSDGMSCCSRQERWTIRAAGITAGWTTACSEDARSLERSRKCFCADSASSTAKLARPRGMGEFLSRGRSGKI